MPRAHFTKAVIRRVSGAPAEGTVAVYRNGTTTPLTQPLYAGDTGTATLANPFSFANGQVEFYLQAPERVRVAITPTDSATQNFDNVDVSAPASLSLAVYDVMTPGGMTAAVQTAFINGDTSHAGVVLPAVPAGVRRVIKNVNVHNGNEDANRWALALPDGDFVGGTEVRALDLTSIDTCIVLNEGDELRWRYTGAGPTLLGMTVSYVDVDPALVPVERLGRLHQLAADGSLQTLVATSTRDRVISQIVLNNRESQTGYATVFITRADGSSITLTRNLKLRANSVTTFNGPLRLAPGDTLNLRNQNVLGSTTIMNASAHGYTRTLD